MKRKSVLMLVLFLSAAGLFSGCVNKDSDDDTLPCLCFRNDSGESVSGIRYRITGTTGWTTSIFDDDLSSGNGYDCSEGRFRTAVAAGTYDFEILNSSNEAIRGWDGVPYNGGSVGFWVTTLASSSMYGAVDGNCGQAGTAYYADR